MITFMYSIPSHTLTLKKERFCWQQSIRVCCAVHTVGKTQVQFHTSYTRSSLQQHPSTAHHILVCACNASTCTHKLESGYTFVTPQPQQQAQVNWNTHTCFAALFVCLQAVSRTFNSLYKVLFNFPSRYLFTIGLTVVFSLSRSLPAALGCTLKQPDSIIHLIEMVMMGRNTATGLSPAMALYSKRLAVPSYLSAIIGVYTWHRYWTLLQCVAFTLGSSRFTRRY